MSDSYGVDWAAVIEEPLPQPGGLRITRQPPVDAIATVDALPSGPQTLWSAIATPSGQSDFPTGFRRIIETIACDRDIKSLTALLEAHVPATDGIVADMVLDVAKHPGYDLRWFQLLRFVRQLGGQTTLGIMTSLDDVGDGPVRLSQLAAASAEQRDEPYSAPSIVIHIDNSFWELTRTQRGRILAHLRVLSSGFSVVVCPSSQLVARKLVTDHETDLPATTVDEIKQERRDSSLDAVVKEAMADLGLGNPHWRLLAAVIHDERDRLTYAEAVADTRLDCAPATVRSRAKRLAELGLVDRLPVGGKQAVVLREAGRCLLKEHPGFRADGRLQPHAAADGEPYQQETDTLSPASDRVSGHTEATGSDAGTDSKFGVQSGAVDDPPQSAASAVYPAYEHGEGGRPDSEAEVATADHTAPLTAPAVAWSDMPTHHGTAAAANAADITLCDHLVDTDRDPRRVELSHDADRDDVMARVSWSDDLPLIMMRLCDALLSKQAASTLLTPDRIDGPVNAAVDEDFAVDGEGREPLGGLEKSNPLILTKARQLGYLDDETFEGGIREFRKRLQQALANLKDDAKDLRDDDGNYDADLAAQLLRDGHGLLGTIVSLLDLAGIEVTLRIDIPEYRRNVHSRSHTVVDLIKKLVRINTVSDQYTAERVLYEGRSEKRNYILGDPGDCDLPTGELVPNIVLVGNGIEALQDELVDGLRDREDERQTDEPGYAPIANRVSVASAWSRRTATDAVRRMASFKRLESTRRAVSVLRGALNSPLDVAEAVHRLGGQDASRRERELRLDELRYALRALDSDHLVPTLPGSRTSDIVAALLEADEWQSTSELAEAAGVSRETLRRRRSELEAVGLVATMQPKGAGRTRQWRFRLPFETEKQGQAPDRRSSHEDLDSLALPATLVDIDAVNGVPPNHEAAHRQLHDAIEMAVIELAGESIICRSLDRWDEFLPWKPGDPRAALDWAVKEWPELRPHFGILLALLNREQLPADTDAGLEPPTATTEFGPPPQPAPQQTLQTAAD